MLQVIFSGEFFKEKTFYWNQARGSSRKHEAKGEKEGPWRFQVERGLSQKFQLFQNKL